MHEGFEKEEHQKEEEAPGKDRRTTQILTCQMCAQKVATIPDSSVMSALR